MAEWLCLPGEECIGQVCYRLVHGADEPLPSCPHVQLLRHGEKWASEVHEERLGGDYLVTVSPLRNSTGELVGGVHIARRAPGRATEGETLREQDEQFRLTFDRSSLGAAIVSLDFRFVRANDALCQITGYSGRELSRLRSSDITHPDDRAGDLDLAKRLVSGEIDRYDIEKRYVRKGGGIVWVHVFAHLTRDALSRPLCVLPIIEDITARRAMELALRDSQRRQMEAEKLAATGRMAACVAHEINNPLAGIRNAFRLIKEAVPEDHPDRDMAERIDKEIARISNVVQQMYTLYSPTADQITEVVVGDVVRDVLSILEPFRRESEIQFDATGVVPELRVRAPDGGLYQVLYNLITNAIEASPPGGVVVIAAEVDDRRPNLVEIRVRDQGAGIPPDIQPRIFEPFLTSRTDNRLKKGLGLGLSVVKSVVEAAGGRIELSSSRGQGTTFRMLFPNHLRAPEE